MPPVTSLPPTYHEVLAVRLTDKRLLLWLNLAVVVPVLISLGPIMLLWQRYADAGAPLALFSASEQIRDAWLFGVLLLIGVLIVHEFCHGLGFAHYGHTPRYGWKPSKFVLYCTADNAYLFRNQYVWVSLLPALMITFGGLLLMLFLPPGFGWWVALAVSLNIGSAVGDYWSIYKAMQYPPLALVRDDADGLTIFMPIQDD